MPKRSCFSTGLAQRTGALDRGEEHVAHLGGLEGKRASPRARSESSGEGEGGEQADRRGTVGTRQSAISDCRELVVADEARDEQHDDDADDRGDVDPVHRVEPVDLLDPLAAARLAHRA